MEHLDLNATNRSLIDLALRRETMLLPIQGELFPLTTLVEMPGSSLTADAWGHAQGSDTQWYLVKGDSKTANARASEWVATKLAEALNFPCAVPKVIQTTTGDLLFGSRLIGRCNTQLETSGILECSTIAANARQIKGLMSFLSKLYAFDLFIKNGDRHDQNLMSLTDRDTIVLYPIDHARSIFYSNPLSGFPNAGEHTRTWGRKIRLRHGWDINAALETLRQISQVAPSLILSFIASMPESWLSQTERHRFLVWWSSAERIERLNDLQKGLLDGSLL